MYIHLSWNMHDQLCNQSIFIDYLKSFKGRNFHVLSSFLIIFCIYNFLHTQYQMQQGILVPAVFHATYMLLWLLILPSASACLCQQASHSSPWTTAKQAVTATTDYNKLCLPSGMVGLF